MEGGSQLRRALCIGSLCLGLARPLVAAADAPPAVAPPVLPMTTDPAQSDPASAGSSDAARAPQAVDAATVVEAPPAEAQLHENGRLAALLCQGQPLRAARCRYGLPGANAPASGLVLTYHATGSVFEVLSFRDGYLDGVVEVYDATGHLLERTLYRAGFAVPLSQVRAPSGSGDPQLPAPPTVTSADGMPGPAAPLAATAPSTIDLDGEAPGAAAPLRSDGANRANRSTAARVAPADRSANLAPVLGLGLRGILGAMISDVAVPGFAGGQLVFAVSPSGNTHPELAIGATTTFDAKGQYRRLDVPISLGLQVNLNRASAPIYMALGMDLLYARRSIPGDVPGPQVEEAWLLGGSGGLGIDLPMWGGNRSQGRILTDVRIGGTGRVDGAPPLLLPQETGEPRAAIAGQFRVLLTMTAQVNFGG